MLLPGAPSAAAASEAEIRGAALRLLSDVLHLTRRLHLLVLAG